jgi:hypothetical protein
MPGKRYADSPACKAAPLNLTKRIPFQKSILGWESEPQMLNLGLTRILGWRTSPNPWATRVVRETSEILGSRPLRRCGKSEPTVVPAASPTPMETSIPPTLTPEPLTTTPPPGATLTPTQKTEATAEPEPAATASAAPTAIGPDGFG